MTETIQINSLDGSGGFDAYAAGPTPARAGVIVIQEIFGINPGIQQMVDRWGALGYRAVAPDLFWRLEPGVSLDADTPDDLQRAFDLYGRFDVDLGITDIAATIKALRDAGCEKVGVVGYCLGALLAYLTACRADSDASVGYYGVGIDGRLEEADAIAQPLMLHIATEDGFVSKEAQAAVHARLNAHPRCTLHDYAADHAFARAIGSSRVPDLAELADRRTAAFFRDNL
ncbi:MAG: dienelactone hydrolase family protein [Polymorphobacter sp.]|uniref:dienelactone hydrolase family protein n=1 Tax=Polymorphobacter sp. TaxID=1909290 RepID=UPI003A89B5B0